jgi:1-aminocyclopropane-1-carboxylate deaminase/D-cysteine desulfhydrase-like pyridoxal-dependent ACC family enzyme
VTLLDEYSGKKYGALTPEACEAIKLLARTEGILLDPVYTGKAMAGLIDMVRLGHFSQDQNVVFIHTGGSLALFRYREELRKQACES